MDCTFRSCMHILIVWQDFISPLYFSETDKHKQRKRILRVGGHFTFAQVDILINEVLQLFIMYLFGGAFSKINPDRWNVFEVLLTKWMVSRS